MNSWSLLGKSLHRVCSAGGDVVAFFRVSSANATRRGSIADGVALGSASCHLLLVLLTASAWCIYFSPLELTYLTLVLNCQYVSPQETEEIPSSVGQSDISAGTALLIRVAEHALGAQTSEICREVSYHAITFPCGARTLGFICVNAEVNEPRRT
jgi:hypothetical protein